MIVSDYLIVNSGVWHFCVPMHEIEINLVA